MQQPRGETLLPKFVRSRYVHLLHPDELFRAPRSSRTWPCQFLYIRSSLHLLDFFQFCRSKIIWLCTVIFKFGGRRGDLRIE